VARVNKLISEANMETLRANISSGETQQLALKIGFELSMLQATEACFIAKGGYRTGGKDQFRTEKFVEWLLLNSPFIKQVPIPRHLIAKESTSNVSAFVQPNKQHNQGFSLTNIIKSIPQSP